jgi:type IV pilus assembly protein PilP
MIFSVVKRNLSVSNRMTAWPLMAVALLLLAGCSNETKMNELREYVEGVVSRPPGQIEPPPQFVSYVAFTYSAASLRSPFDVPLDAATAMRSKIASKVKPDENRPKEYLEGFALNTLTMVGTIGRGNQLWALIRDETGNVNRVTNGNFLGKNFGRIVTVSQTQVELMEIVPTGDGGWIERPQTIMMAQ